MGIYVFLIRIISVATLLLLLGDFSSTFFYRVSEHLFGNHSLVHHRKNSSFVPYAVLIRNSLVLLDGFAVALPYFIFIPMLWEISSIGTIVGLILGELHIIWRHSQLNWQTPLLIQKLCNCLFITTPERHWLHH